MKICYLDAFSGISGDMTVGALVDAGAPAGELIQALESLGTGATFEVGKTVRRGITASKFRVNVPEAPQKHRHLHHVLEMIERGALSAKAKQSAARVFERLAEAEAEVHGTTIQKVHFHEVGAVDSIADIVGASVALDLLGIEELHVSPVNVGSGTVETEHGVLPVPAPATARLLKGKPIYAKGPAMELTTPTGAALAVTLSASFGALPAMNLSHIGHGAGDRDIPSQANVLRALIGEKSRAPEATVVSVLEANIDDSSPQVLGYAMDRLMEAGALDVTITPLQMKKNRPGAMLSVIAKPEDQERLARIVFEETSTLGLRIHAAERRVEDRRVVEVETPFGCVRGKVSREGVFAPEYEDAKSLARAKGVPLKRVQAAAVEAFLRGRS